MKILQFISEHGLDTLLIALVDVILTGLIKMPIKKLASKSAKSKKITRFITFLPLFIGFGVTALMLYIAKKEVVFDQTFFTRWLSAVSLSLAIYAYWENFVPSEKKILSEAEIGANKQIIEELQNKIGNKTPIAKVTTVAEEIENCQASVIDIAQAENEQLQNHKKIILTNNKNNK